MFHSIVFLFNFHEVEMHACNWDPYIILEVYCAEISDYLYVQEQSIWMLHARVLE